MISRALAGKELYFMHAIKGTQDRVLLACDGNNFLQRTYYMMMFIAVTIMVTMFVPSKINKCELALIKKNNFKLALF